MPVQLLIQRGPHYRERLGIIEARPEVKAKPKKTTLSLRAEREEIDALTAFLEQMEAQDAARFNRKRAVLLLLI